MPKKTKRAKSALPYFRRAAEDEYVQAQLRNAVARLREAWVRAARQGDKAAEDKKLYANLREAATSIRRAAIRVGREPKPKRRGRKLAAAALAGGGAAFALSRKRKTQPTGPAHHTGETPESGGAAPGPQAAANPPVERMPGD